MWSPCLARHGTSRSIALDASFTYHFGIRLIRLVDSDTRGNNNCRFCYRVVQYTLCNAVTKGAWMEVGEGGLLPDSKFKKQQKFCRHDDSKRFT